LNTSTFFCECGINEVDYMALHSLSDPTCVNGSIGMFSSTLSEDYLAINIDFYEKV